MTIIPLHDPARAVRAAVCAFNGLGGGAAPSGFADSELTSDDIRPALETSAGRDTGCVAAPPPWRAEPLVREAYHLGALQGEAGGYRAGYVSGWRWGAVCGLVAGCAVVALALLVGRWVGLQ